MRITGAGVARLQAGARIARSAGAPRPSAARLLAAADVLGELRRRLGALRAAVVGVGVGVGEVGGRLAQPAVEAAPRAAAVLRGREEELGTVEDVLVEFVLVRFTRVSAIDGDAPHKWMRGTSRR